MFKKIWNSPEQPVELTKEKATETGTQHLWYSYVATIVGHDYGVIIKGL